MTQPTPPIAPPPPSDEGVPRITHMRRSDGWRYRAATPTAPEMFIDPQGVEYVAAHHREPADLIRLYLTPGLTPTRLRRYADSSAKRKAERKLRALNKRKTA